MWRWLEKEERDPLRKEGKKEDGKVAQFRETGSLSNPHFEQRNETSKSGKAVRCKDKNPV